MKYLFYSLITFILWLLALSILEYDHRHSSGMFLATFSPLQWSLLFLMIWCLLSTLNLYIIVRVTGIDFDKVNLNSWIMILSSNTKVKIIFSLVPLTQLVVLFVSFIEYLKRLNNVTEDEIKKQEFEKFLHENHVQEQH